MKIARLNPTANGPLHIGHIYNALVNQAMSDKLILRFDDDQAEWIVRLGRDTIQHYAEGQLDDLEWMGIIPTETYYNSRLQRVVRRVMASSPHWRLVEDHRRPLGDPELAPIIVSNPPIEPWAPTLYLTAEKVILDHYNGVNVMARGLELLQENALYLYYCGIFGFPWPRMIYIPRLMTKDGGELSKTVGDEAVRDLRQQGMHPGDVRDLLTEACLIDPDKGWHVGNIESEPRLG